MRSASVWCLPLTLVGHALRLFTPGCTIVKRGGVTLVYGAGAARLLDAPRYAAMAVGEVIFARNRADMRTHLAHELEHVRQSRKLGVVFPLAYLASSLWCLATGKRAYWDNRFETAARRVER